MYYWPVREVGIALFDITNHNEVSMPNWKKVIVSGSNAELSSLNVANAVTASLFKGNGADIVGVISSSYALTASFAFSAYNSDRLNNQSGSYYLFYEASGSSIYDFIYVRSPIIDLSKNVSNVTFYEARDIIANTTSKIEFYVDVIEQP